MKPLLVAFTLAACALLLVTGLLVGAWWGFLHAARLA